MGRSARPARRRREMGHDDGLRRAGRPAEPPLRPAVGGGGGCARSLAVVPRRHRCRRRDVALGCAGLRRAPGSPGDQRNEPPLPRPQVGDHSSEDPARRPRRLGRRGSRPHGVLERARMAGLLRRCAVPTAAHGMGEPEPEVRRHRTRHRRRGTREVRSLVQGRNRIRHRRRRHATTDRHRLDAQPGPDDRGELPRQGPASAVAVGCAMVHAASRRR